VTGGRRPPHGRTRDQRNRPRSRPARTGTGRADRRLDRRQRGHRARDRPARPGQPDRRRLSASLLGDRLEERRNELRATLPIGRVVGPAATAALAVHIMTNTALTGATYDIDGGQQFVS
jgi:hypothetical protein